MKRFPLQSPGSSRWRLAVPAAVVVVLLAVGIAFGAYFVSEAIDGTSVAQETDEPTAAALAATAEPSPEASAAPADAEAEAAATPEEALPPTPVFEGKGDPVERAKQATAADRAKPRFRGELGDFVIVEAGTATGYPCPEPYQPGTNPERSELYFNLPGAVIDMVGSCQGTIIAITAFVPDGVNGAMVGRGYFLGPKLEEPFDAPAERLKLITVGGRPALAEVPIPDCMVCTSQVVVIERFPSEAGLGIAVSARTTNDLDRAIALVEQIMGVRQ